MNCEGRKRGFFDWGKRRPKQGICPKHFGTRRIRHGEMRPPTYLELLLKALVGDSQVLPATISVCRTPNETPKVCSLLGGQSRALAHGWESVRVWGNTSDSSYREQSGVHCNSRPGNPFAM
jgi:hypothetical protein